MHVFTYGSLMFPEVWRRVVRGDYRSALATLDGHARFAVTGETYPGMVAQAGASVRGIVYFDVTQEDIAALDVFEGSDYRRDRVLVALALGETVEAGAYIYRDTKRLATHAWDPGHFQMQRFLQSYCGFAPGE